MQGSDKAMAAHEQHRQIASLHFVNDSWLRSSLSHFVNLLTSTPAFCKVASGKTSQKPFNKHLKMAGFKLNTNSRQIRDQRCKVQDGPRHWSSSRNSLQRNASQKSIRYLGHVKQSWIRIRHVRIKADLKNTAFKKGIPEFACPSYPRSPLARHRWARDPVGYPTRLAEKSTLFVDILPFWCWGFPQTSKPISNFSTSFFNTQVE